MMHLSLVQKQATTAKAVSPFQRGHYIAWGAISALPLVGALLLRAHYPLFGGVFLLASTVKGYLYGVALPKAVKDFVHPLVTCTLYGSFCCWLWGALTGQGYRDVLSMFLQQVRAEVPHDPPHCCFPGNRGRGCYNARECDRMAGVLLCRVPAAWGRATF